MQFKDVPEIQTQRLSLRVLNTNDVVITFALRSNVEVIKYIEREPLSFAEAENKTQEIVKYIENNQSISWTIKFTAENKKIGSICLWNFSKDKMTAEIGYDLLPKYHNKGIMNEALKSVLQFGFNNLKLKTIEAFTSKYNQGSVALLEKNNFVLDAKRKDEGFPDNVVFSLKR